MDKLFAQYMPVYGRQQPEDLPKGLLGHAAEADRVRQSAEDAASYNGLVQNPYALDKLMLAAGRLTGPGKILDAVGYYPKAGGGFNPSFVENVNNGNRFAAFMQAGGLGAQGISGPLSGIPAWKWPVSSLVAQPPRP